MSSNQKLFGIRRIFVTHFKRIRGRFRDHFYGPNGRWLCTDQLVDMFVQSVDTQDKAGLLEEGPAPDPAVKTEAEGGPDQTSA